MNIHILQDSKKTNKVSVLQ